MTFIFFRGVGQPPTSIALSMNGSWIASYTTDRSSSKFPKIMAMWLVSPQKKRLMGGLSSHIVIFIINQSITIIIVIVIMMLIIVITIYYYYD